MKKCLAVASLLLCQHALATSDLCKQIDGAAETVMKARQQGVPIAEIYKSTEKADSYVQGLFRMTAKEAYSKPRFSSEEYQQKAVDDFRNEMFMACLSYEDDKKR